MLIRDWDTDHRKVWPGTKFGVRLYTIDGIRFARCYCSFSGDLYDHGYHWAVFPGIAKYVKSFDPQSVAPAKEVKQTGG